MTGPRLDVSARKVACSDGNWSLRVNPRPLLIRAALRPQPKSEGGSRHGR
ncbi:MAG: hypothetical protein QOJ61_1435 [Mycobacterium sp.]|jgi:hypothetical protein|nr:hypothetical protein [Mycobacterium sp.]